MNLIKRIVQTLAILLGLFTIALFIFLVFKLLEIIMGFGVILLMLFIMIIVIQIILDKYG